MKKVNVCLVLALVVVLTLGSVVWAQDDPSPIAVTGVSLNLTSLDIVVGDQRQLEATVSPATATNQNLTWTSSNTSIATVQAIGSADSGLARVTAVAPGTTTIVVSTLDGGLTATTSVTVRAATTTPPTGGGSYALYFLLAGALITVTALTMRRLKDQIV